ncbi:MAG: hypothetical protein ABFD08_07775 [Syntrophomonas sp.]
MMLDSIIPCDKSNKDDDQIHHWSIKEIGFDVQYKDSFYGTRIYSDLGKLRGVIKPLHDPIKGVSADSCCFREGDLVEVLYGGKIVVGVITRLPDSPKVVEGKNVFWKENPLRDLKGNEYSPYCAEGDNAYIVRFNKKEYNYSTFPECLLFKLKFKIKKKDDAILNNIRNYFLGIFEKYDISSYSSKYDLELNKFMLDIIKEPHIVIYCGYDYLLVSLDSLEIIAGNRKNFAMREVGKIMKIISKNHSMFQERFAVMREEYKRFNLTDENEKSDRRI